MISARACGVPALAVPGDQAWYSAWAGFEDRDVTIVMDADRAGRLAAQRGCRYEIATAGADRPRLANSRR
jgi:hypothetical protein